MSVVVVFFFLGGGGGEMRMTKLTTVASTTKYCVLFVFFCFVFVNTMNKQKTELKAYEDCLYRNIDVTCGLTSFCCRLSELFYVIATGEADLAVIEKRNKAVTLQKLPDWLPSPDNHVTKN